MRFQVFRYVNPTDVEFLGSVRTDIAFEPNQEIYLNDTLYVVSHCIRRFFPFNGVANPQEELTGLLMVKAASANKEKYLRQVLTVAKTMYAQVFDMLGVK